ncbi:polar growth protein [Arachnomyces sp. PD_36]|nr:polar growth protein [Arachnomyces sp. PD_36]
MSREPELPRGVVPGDFLIVIHDFDARTEDELSLRRGDRIQLIELDDEFGDGWYLGKHTVNGGTGIFPGVYTKAPPRAEAVPTENPPSYASSCGSSEPAVAQEEKPVDSKTPDINGEITPQASRHVSTSSEKPTLDLPETTRSATPPMSQHRPSSMASNPPLSPGIQRTISETIDNHMNGEESPVMNETLSVIDEHITDLSTPRHSVVAKEQTGGGMDSESDYSSHDNRMSYIHGHETDEEEENNPMSEENVKSWDHQQTAQYLRQIGVDSKHCDIFQEQEISGDVLLDMDQSFIYMKEFDFGVMGRRLKTWHKIKAFQEEVKGIAHFRQSSSAYSGRESATPDEYDRSQSRAGMTSPFLPRIPSLTGPHGSNYRQSRESSSSAQQRYTKRNGMTQAPNRNNMTSPLPSFSSTSAQHDSVIKPSAASIRDANQSRRHSSIDATPRSPVESMRAKGNQPRPSHIAHQHKDSFDKSWTMTSGTHGVNDHTRTSLGNGARRDMFGKSNGNGSDSAITFVDSPDDMDRGYFSGGELETRRTRNVLKKRDSASGAFTHSAQSSIVDDRAKNSNFKRHSRFGSADSIRDMVTPASAASKAYNTSSLKTRFRSSSARAPESPGSQSHSPTVTNLEQNTTSTPGFFSAFTRQDSENSGRSSPLPSAKNVTPKVRRALGLRAISDAVTGSEREATMSPVPSSPLKETPQSPARTGSSTPSAASKSFGRDSTDGSSKAGENTTTVFASRPKLAVKPGVKSKKETSAYMRGLEKKSPQEQMVDCDYSGWMKKKSSHLMTTWKPRFFVLRGRRLSYYYSENDTEEKGLIDISSHRVLRADQDPIAALHAAVSGAKASVTSPTHSASPSTDADSSTSNLARPKPNSTESPFIFKLVPPKTGLSRAVQFTKPAVHFFQVDNVKQGRLWMAALMKATIERDPDLPVQMTNKQKTISLKQARAMNQRPPALMSLDDKEEPKPEDDLNIHAIIFDDPPANGDGYGLAARPGSLG